MISFLIIIAGDGIVRRKHTVGELMERCKQKIHQRYRKLVIEIYARKVRNEYEKDAFLFI
jgi:hypothetical protein